MHGGMYSGMHGGMHGGMYSRMYSGMHSGMQTLLTWRSGRNQRVLLIPSCRAARSATNSVACLEGWMSPAANATPVPFMPGPWQACLHPGMAVHPPAQLPSCLLAQRDYTAAPAAIWEGEPALRTQGTTAHVTQAGWRGQAVQIKPCTQNSPRRAAKPLQSRAGAPSAEGHHGQSGGPHQTPGDNGPGWPVQPLPLGFNRLVAYLTCPIM